MSKPEILDRLQNVSKSGDEWSARCPAHEDRKASLSIGMGDEGKTLVCCHAGCSAESVVQSLGLTMKDLMPSRNGNRVNGRTTEVGCPKSMATRPDSDNRTKISGNLKRAIESYISYHNKEKSDREKLGKPTGEWEYCDSAGESVGMIVRWDTPGGKVVRPFSFLKRQWKCKAMPSPRPLYNLPELATASVVWVAEGEKAADSLRKMGIVATTSAGGSSSPKKTDWSPLVGKSVIIWPDRDVPGIEYAVKVLRLCEGLSPSAEVRTIAPETLPLGDQLPEGGDAADWVALYEGVDSTELRNMLDIAAEKTPVSRSIPEPITNAETEEIEADGKPKKVTTPLTMNEVVTRIFAFTNGWPRRVDDATFVDDPPRGVSWLEKATSLFGWLQSTHSVFGPIVWSRSEGCVSRDEVFHEVRRVATAYDQISSLPHEPPIENIYYSGKTPEPGDGTTLSEFLDYFTLETPIDRELLTAILATPLWGGPPGSRPAAMFTASTGRGKGKSVLAQFIGRVYGGTIDVSPQDDIGKIKGRLLSPGAADRRIALLDNVKSTRFSWGELESLVTANAISGHRLYVGEGVRPNILTWFVTLNGASLSTDMAQRVVEIRLADPEYDDLWEEKASVFISERQLSIIGDLIAFLRQPPKPMQRHSRWATWEGSVLSRVEHPDDCLAAILDRRAETDVEEEEGLLIEDYFAEKLRWLAYDPERDDVFIPNPIVVRWYSEATGDRSKRVTGVTRAMRQMKDEGRLRNLVNYRSGGTGKRGFRWVPEHCLADTPIDFDLQKRLIEKTENPDQT